MNNAIKPNTVCIHEYTSNIHFEVFCNLHGVFQSFEPREDFLFKRDITHTFPQSHVKGALSGFMFFAKRLLIFESTNTNTPIPQQNLAHI